LNHGIQYPFGYIFGESEYAGATETEQTYYSRDPLMGMLISATDKYYIPNSLANVTVTGVNSTILYGAFQNCNNIKNITLGEGVNNIAYNSFNGCSSLENVNIGNNVASIGKNAFAGCEKLANVTIGNGVNTIGESAFNGCKGLKNLNIGSSIASIEKYAFKGCENLDKVNISNINGWYVIDFATPESNPVYYAKKLYLNDNLVTKIDVTDANAIKNYAFINCESLKSVTIGGKSFYIGARAFDNCINIEKLTLSEGLVNIGDYAFRNLKSLLTVNIPSTVTTIGEDAFDGCEILYKLYINDLEGWCNITFATVKSNPLYFANNLYVNGKLMIQITIPKSVTEIKNYAFAGATNVLSIVIHRGVTAIGENVLLDCENLENIYYGCGSNSAVSTNRWYSIKINSSNEELNNAKLYFYSPTEPTVEGFCWYYAEDGATILIWYGQIST